MTKEIDTYKGGYGLFIGCLCPLSIDVFAILNFHGTPLQELTKFTIFINKL